jgi:hypothetical protein
MGLYPVAKAKLTCYEVHEYKNVYGYPIEEFNNFRNTQANMEECIEYEKEYLANGAKSFSASPQK